MEEEAHAAWATSFAVCVVFIALFGCWGYGCQAKFDRDTQKQLLEVERVRIQAELEQARMDYGYVETPIEGSTDTIWERNGH